MKHKIAFWLYSFAIALIIILADLDLLPLHLLRPIPRYDWAAHLILYGLFYRLLSKLLNGRCLSIKSRSIEMALAATVILITAEETSQLLFSSRTFSLMDLLMGFLGIFLFRIPLPFRAFLRKKYYN